MNITINSIVVSGEEIEAIVSMKSQVAFIFDDAKYGVRSAIENKIVTQVADKIVSERADEIASKIDIESLVKRIQLNVVNNILSGSRG